MGELERADADRADVDVVRLRPTVVVALPLRAQAQERLAALLGARVVDMRTECPEADLVLAPSSSPQLLGRLAATYPKARIVVTELEDEELDIELTGPVTRLLRGGADGYVVADSVEDLARKLAAPAAAGDGSEKTAERREHSMPTELHASNPLDDLVELLRPIATEAEVRRRAEG